jgi:Ca2+-dependent lipid-binding protein
MQKLYEDLTEAKERYSVLVSKYKEEKYNQYGVSEHAELIVNIVKAKDLQVADFGGKADPYTILKLDKEKFISSYKTQSLTPIWNEECVLHPESKDRILIVEVWDKDKYQDDLVGSIKLPLRDFENQLKYDQWYPLFDGDGVLTEGSIHLKIQFFWSRLNYYKEFLDASEKKLEQVTESINELNKFFKLFEKPFGLILYCDIDNLEVMENKLFEKANAIVNQNEAGLRKTAFSIMSPRSNQVIMPVREKPSTQNFSIYILYKYRCWLC